MPCGNPMKVWLPKGYDYKEYTVKCGQTSLTGDPYLCEKCQETDKDIDWRERAREAGERYDDDY